MVLLNNDSEMNEKSFSIESSLCFHFPDLGHKLPGALKTRSPMIAMHFISTMNHKENWKFLFSLQFVSFRVEFH